MAENLAALPADSRTRWLNAFLACVNTPAPAPELPRSVVFELAATCNYACEDCGVGAHGPRNDRTMSVENLGRWAGQVCGNADVIRINGLGEATLHPELSRCVEILGAYPGGREIITNFSAPADTYRMLLEAGFVLLISWDAASPTLFERIRKHSSFDELRRKLPRVTAAAAASRAPPPVLLFTLRPANISELNETVALAAANGISRVTVNVLRTRSGADWTPPYRDEIRRAFDDSAATADRHGVALLGPDHLGDDPLRHRIAARSSNRGCSFPWTQVVIGWDGRVSACNMMNPYLHGDLRSLPFQDIWAGPSAQSFRVLANGPDRHPYCRECYYVHAGGEVG